MDCRDARDRILQAEGPPIGPLLGHVAGCDACSRLLADLAQLEDAWRAIPLPPGSDRGRRAFLDRLPDLEAPAPRARRAPMARRWLVAASILVALGLWGGVLVSGRRASASTDVVERLVDWNLDLARVESAGERGRLYADRAPALASEVERAGLPDGDRELAEALLATAPGLVRDADPLADAGRLDALADRLLRRIDAASGRGDARRVERFARLYGRVVDLGLGSRFEALDRSGALDFDRQRGLERLILRDSDRIDALVALLERAPDASRKEIKKALGVARNPKVKPKVKIRKPRPGEAPPAP